MVYSEVDLRFKGCTNKKAAAFAFGHLFCFVEYLWYVLDLKASIAIVCCIVVTQSL